LQDKNLCLGNLPKQRFFYLAKIENIYSGVDNLSTEARIIQGLWYNKEENKFKIKKWKIKI